jgi:hypothetical protein
VLVSHIDHVSLVALSAIGYLVSYVTSYVVGCRSVRNKEQMQGQLCNWTPELSGSNEA